MNGTGRGRRGRRTSPTRRTVLAGLAATSAGAIALRHAHVAAASPPVHQLKAMPGTAQLLEGDAPATAIWGYQGRVPGPELRTLQGVPFAADLLNGLTQETTIHWHGIRINNAMDGVARMTQAPVPPGGTFTYRFTPPDAGTYWYHPHNRTWEQMARGLYGAFVVEETTPPAVDQDIVMVFDDWRLEDDGRIHEASFGHFHDLSHEGRLGNVLTVNGQPFQDFSVKAGERIRLRLINTANARVLAVQFADHRATVVALDGQPVTPFAADNDRVTLAPAQRADIILDCSGAVGSKTPIRVLTGRNDLTIGHLVYDGRQRARRTALTDSPALPPNPMPTDLALEQARDVTLAMTGGAMAWLTSANYRGKSYDGRTLARTHKQVWAFNGVAGMPEAPLVRAERGETVRVRMRNETLWPHAMHFHGHHVREVAHSARAPLPHWRDTIFMDREEEVTVAFHAHNPGKWMLHCHMLEHQSAGMATWYEVV